MMHNEYLRVSEPFDYQTAKWKDVEYNIILCFIDFLNVFFIILNFSFGFIFVWRRGDKVLKAPKHNNYELNCE